jgi:uncharacterized membrane protein YhaH (DUF805 family)
MYSVGYQLIVVIDCILMPTTIAGTMLSMLQDRRRPVWPVLVAMIPFMALGVAYMVCYSETIELISAAYLLLLCLLFNGTAVITVTSTVDPSVSKSCTITVSDGNITLNTDELVSQSEAE